MAGALVRSIILSGAEEKIRELGEEPEAVAEAAGLPVAALRDPDLLITGRSVMLFLDVAARMCSYRNMGLHMAMGNRLAAIVGPLSVLLRNACTVGEMCKELADNYDLYSSAALTNFEMLGENGILSWTAASGQVDNEIQVAEFALGIFLSEIRSHGPADWSPVEVRFRHQPPKDLSMHRRFFGPHLRFNSTHNALLLDGAVLSRRLRGGRAGNKSLTRMIVRLEESAPVAAIPLHTERIIRSLLPFSPCGIEDVAQAMGTSVRTLQKHLNGAGQGFREIKETVRRDLARKYLQYSDMSATEIADLLGYADLTSFSRAFRRWHGQSIRELRQRSADE